MQQALAHPKDGVTYDFYDLNPQGLVLRLIFVLLIAPGFEESSLPGLLSGRRNLTAKPSPVSRGAQYSFKCNGPEGEDKGEGELQSDVRRTSRKLSRLYE